MRNTVKARLSRGLQDLRPETTRARQQIIDTVRSVYESYGFVPLDTPAIEYLDVLSGSAGEETQQSIFRVSNPEEEELGLRFDLTVPLARVVAQYRDLPRPFRRYQVAQVWRADKPDKGRFREFTQFDIDTVGVRSHLADTEIIAAMCDTLSALDVGEYRVRFSSRRILNLLLAFAEIPANRADDVFRVLDKLEKIGFEKVRLELTTGYKDESGDTIKGQGLSDVQVDRIEAFLAIPSDNRDEAIRQLRVMFASVKNAAEEIDIIEDMSRHLAALGYGDDQVSLDLSIARGLAYYTGPVFEAILLDAPQYGSVFGGGRYDGLVTRFSKEQVPATGASIGIDRLLAALVHLKRIRLEKATAQVLVTTMDKTMTDEYLAMTYELRRAGVRTELYLGKPGGFGKQIKYADAYEIPIVIVCGSNERDKGVVTLKDMTVGRELSGEVDSRKVWLKERPGQFEVPRGDVVRAVKKLLADLGVG
jgi:histidyl-tRNA synthetase